jgi:hypothetical protein
MGPVDEGAPRRARSAVMRRFGPCRTIGLGTRSSGVDPACQRVTEILLNPHTPAIASTPLIPVISGHDIAGAGAGSVSNPAP